MLYQKTHFADELLLLSKEFTQRIMSPINGPSDDILI